MDTALSRELAIVAQQRILFGHQSVGANVLQGLEKLAGRENARLRVTSVRVAENRQPLRKLRSFEQALASSGERPTVALLKFCYVDIAADTDAEGLFGEYRAMLARLRAAHPGTVFVHVTLPLTTVQCGPKALAKRLLGRHPYGTLENLRREEYNALLRAAYRGREAIFDLAQVESTAPDGAAVTVTWKGRRAPALAPRYTDDGGHLNAAGGLRAARELVRVLAGIVRQVPPVVRSDLDAQRMQGLPVLGVGNDPHRSRPC